MTDSTRDEDAVASLLVPDDTSQAALIDLFDTLERAGFGIALRDGYDSQDAIAYDLTTTNSLTTLFLLPARPKTTTLPIERCKHTSSVAQPLKLLSPFSQPIRQSQRNTSSTASAQIQTSTI
jgi:hypothetical protein